jgi:spoIIIJ-associated protein
MNERATLEKIAPTVEEAIADGLAELGLQQEDVDVEVLDSGSRGLLGIGGRQARIRLTIKTSAVMNVDSGQQQLELSVASEAGDGTLDLARQILGDMLEKMNVNATIEASHGIPDEQGERPILLDIHGPDLGILVGRHAEILNALQYLVNLMVSKQVEHWVQVVIDVEGYRARRERQLRQLARRMADQAVKAGRRQSLEPMPANERRFIHIELRDYPGVTTQSVGEEPNRKVTIVPKE